MRKLLSADFSRLRKARIFWLGIIFMFGLGIFVVCTMYSDIIRYNYHVPLDNALFAYAIFNGCCSAVFCSKFSGTEYSDGTIRNKLIVGHLRSSIYLSNWLTNSAATILMAFAFLCSYCTLGSLLLEAPQVSWGLIFYYLFISIFTMIAFASIFTMLAMLIDRKSSSAIVCLLVFFGLLIMAITIMAKLDAPEFIPYYSFTINGVEQIEQVPNPKYLQPAQRIVYQFFLDMLPTGQSIQLSAFNIVNPILMMVYSIAISVITTVLGVFAFRKKNLK